MHIVAKRIVFGRNYYIDVGLRLQQRWPWWVGSQSKSPRTFPFPQPRSVRNVLLASLSRASDSRSPARCPFTLSWGRVPLLNRLQKVGSLILTSLLEDLGFHEGGKGGLKGDLRRTASKQNLRGA